MPKLAKIVQRLRIVFYKLASDCRNTTGSPKRRQPLLITGKGCVSFGRGVELGVFPSPGFYNTYAHIESRGKQASISIGDNVMINNNCFICSEGAGVTIGSDCLIGHNVQIFDSDFHHLAPDMRRTGLPATAKVIIGRNVFIGANVIISKGVHIGDNCVLGTGAIVTRSIPANTTAAGNPATVIKTL